MRTTVTGALCAAILALSAPGCGHGANPPGAASDSHQLSLVAPEEHLTPPVAVVNGVTIYHVTYDQILDALRDQIPPGDQDSVDRFISARDRALDKAIDEELLSQEGVKRGYGPKDDEVLKLYAERVAQAGSEERFLAGVRNSLMTKSELIYSYRRTMTIDRFVKSEIEAKLTASPEEEEAFYRTRPELFTPDRWLKVGQIFVNAALGLPMKQRSDALTKLSRGLDKMRAGQSFESVAREFSEDESASQGGLIGWVKRGGLAEQLDRAVFALKPGQMSNIIESERGYHLLKVYDSKGGVLEPFEKVKDKVHEKVIQKKRADALSGLLRHLRDGASIERLSL